MQHGQQSVTRPGPLVPVPAALPALPALSDTNLHRAAAGARGASGTGGAGGLPGAAERAEVWATAAGASCLVFCQLSMVSSEGKSDITARALTQPVQPSLPQDASALLMWKDLPCCSILAQDWHTAVHMGLASAQPLHHPRVSLISDWDSITWQCYAAPHGRSMMQLLSVESTSACVRPQARSPFQQLIYDAEPSAMNALLETRSPINAQLGLRA